MLDFQAIVTLMLISFEQLITSVTKEYPGLFARLKEAVQFLKSYETPASSVSPTTVAHAEGISGDNVSGTGQPDSVGTAPVDSVGTPPINPTQSTPVSVDSPVVPSSNSSDVFTYSAQALADISYTVPNSPVGYIISKLKVLTWDVQNTAIGSISPTLLNNASQDELFVLGRNILQTASGSSFSADNFIGRFPNNLMGTHKEALEHVFNGMLYEMYFDSTNEFRGPKGKTPYLDTLYGLYKGQPALRECGKFIATALASHQSEVLFIPELNENPHTIKLRFQSLPDDGERRHYDCILTACYIDKDDISREIEDGEDAEGFRLLRYYNNSVQDIANAIRVSRYIPVANAVFEYELNGQPASIDQVRNFVVERSLYV